MPHSSPFQPFNPRDDLAKLSFPPGVSIRRTNADPVEVRFPSPSPFQLKCLAERFVGQVGEENVRKLLGMASRGDSLFQEVFEFDPWRDLGVIFGERVAFNNRRYSHGVRTKEYSIRRIQDEEGDGQEDWRSASALVPRVVVRRIEHADHEPRLHVAVSFEDPLPWKDSELLAGRWKLIDDLLESEDMARPPAELTEHVIAQNEQDALVQCDDARVKIVPHVPYSAAAQLLEEDISRGIGMELETVIRSGNELNAIVRAAGVPLRRQITDQLFTMTKANAPLERVDLASLLSNPIPLEIMRCREVVHESGSMTYDSNVYMACVSPYGDLYLTLSSDQRHPSRVVTVSCAWDKRTLKFPKGKWAAFAVLFDDIDGRRTSR